MRTKEEIESRMKAFMDEDVYQCEHCGEKFRKSEILYREYGGEIGRIAYCPRCREATKLICVSGMSE